jgi:hypothetical protein
MSSCKSNPLLNQHPEPVLLQWHRLIWDGGSYAMPSNATQDPLWWIEFVDARFFENQVFANQAHQVSHVAPAGVSAEIPRANEAGPFGIEAAFETTCHQTFGLRQQQFKFDVPSGFDIDFEPEAAAAGPDVSNSKVVQASTSPTLSDWNPGVSDSGSSFELDVHANSERSFNLQMNETFYEESQENIKCPIPRPDLPTCPHCCEAFSSERFK